MKILVTGGAGYIGSHVARTLGEAGHDLVIYDNLSTGHEWAILSGRLVRGDLADKRFITETLKAFRPDAVIHFAASIQVEESVRDATRLLSEQRHQHAEPPRCDAGDGRPTLHLFLDRSRLRHPRKDPRRRAGAARADQSLRRLEDDDRNGSSPISRPQRISAIRRSATSTSPGRTRKAESARRTEKRRT